MSGSSQAFLARQPIVDRGGELLGYELLFRARAGDQQARFDDEDHASLNVLSTLLHDIGASQVLAGRLGFVNIGAGALRETSALVLMNPRRTVLELSRSVAPDPRTLERVGALREMGFGIAVTVAPGAGDFQAWRPVASHFKVDLREVLSAQLDVFAATLRYGDQVLVAEKVETADEARHCLDLGFHALQGWHVGRPEVMGSVTPGVSHAVVRRALAQVAAGAPTAELVATFRSDAALCWRLLRYIAASNFGMMIPVDSLGHAVELVGARRLARWLELLLSTVAEPSPAAATLLRAAAFRGRMLELVGAGYFGDEDCENLFVVGALSLLPAMLMCPMSEAIASLALPEPVVDALVSRQGRYGPLLDLVDAMESGDDRRVRALCEILALPSRALDRARRSAEAAVHDVEIA